MAAEGSVKSEGGNCYGLQPLASMSFDSFLVCTGGFSDSEIVKSGSNIFPGVISWVD